jgi:hypothetical protein
MACTAANIEPLIATGRQPHHHPSWRERFAAPPPAPQNPTSLEAMAWRLRTPQGKQLYGLRKQTPEPVFGIIKIGDGIPPIPAARARLGPRRVEPRHHGLEHQVLYRASRRDCRACALKMQCCPKEFISVEYETPLQLNISPL